MSLFMHLYLKRENARRDEEMHARGLTLETYTEDMRVAEREKGDDATVSPPFLKADGVGMKANCAFSSSATRPKYTGKGFKL